MDKRPKLSPIVKKLFQSSNFSSNVLPHVYEHANSGITITDYEGTIIDVNPSFTRITGYTHDDAVGQNPRVLRSDYQDDKFYEKLWKDIKGRGFFQSKIWNRRKTGDTYPEVITIKRITLNDAPEKYFVAVFSEITLLHQDDNQINLAYYDALTKLPNRQLLHEHLEKIIQNLGSKTTSPTYPLQGKQFVVLFFDLDKFKAVNDTHGHYMGDLLLKEVVKRLSKLVRQMDLLSRLGGDEFVLVSLVNDPKKDATIIAEKIREILNTPFNLDNQEINIGVSIGISVYPTDGKYPEKLIKNADTAMYKAKETKGKNAIVFYKNGVKS